MTFDNGGAAEFFGMIFIFPILFYFTFVLFEGISENLIHFFRYSDRRPRMR